MTHRFAVLALAIVILGPLLLVAAPVLAQAQPVQPDRTRLLMPPPLLEPRNPDGSRCFNLINSAPYTVTGSMVTAPYETADAAGARQRLNFRLRPQENRRFCTFGPFYPGDRLELVIRTIVPLFSCYTAAQGDIIIRGEVRAEGGTRSWAECM